MELRKANLQSVWLEVYFFRCYRSSSESYSRQPELPVIYLKQPISLSLSQEIFAEEEAALVAAGNVVSAKNPLIGLKLMKQSL